MYIMVLPKPREKTHKVISPTDYFLIQRLIDKL